MSECGSPLLQQLAEASQSLHEAETELCLSQLRNMNTIYTTIIQKKQAEMKYSKYVLESARSSGEAHEARHELRRSQAECVDLYSYWLKELHDMEVSLDKRAFTLHQMLVGNCHWFLAKYSSLKSSASPAVCSSQEGFEEAIAAYDRIFAFLRDDLPSCNAFYLFLLKRYSLLVLEAKEYNADHAAPGNSEEHDMPKQRSSATDGKFFTCDEDFVGQKENITDQVRNKHCKQNGDAQTSSGGGDDGDVEVPRDGPRSLTERPKQKAATSRCRQAGVNVLRHLTRLRQCIQLHTGYVPKAIRNGIDDVSKIVQRIHAIDIKDQLDAH